jgi:hypothetical protein
MKKLLISLFTLAIVYRNGGIDVSSSPVITVGYDVVYIDSYTIGLPIAQTITLTGSPVGLSSTTINTGITAGVRSQATSDGITIPANQVIMQPWQCF